ncbi:MAG: hypothetical protein QOF68_3229 [Gaiellales bacterium]|jgi:hypothetical protein|nr:hypothetical protein [Gaiellales bacterium]
MYESRAIDLGDERMQRQAGIAYGVLSELEARDLSAQIEAACQEANRQHAAGLDTTAIDALITEAMDHMEVTTIGDLAGLTGQRLLEYRAY